MSRSVSNAKMKASVLATLTNTDDNYPNAQIGFNESASISISSGNCDQIFQDKIDLAASGRQAYDLDAGGMSDPFGNVIFASIIGYLIKNTGETSLKVDGDILGLSTDGDTIEAGGFIMRSFGSGRTVTADTGDEIQLTNLSSEDAGNFEILIFGKG